MMQGAKLLRNRARSRSYVRLPLVAVSAIAALALVSACGIGTGQSSQVVKNGVGNDLTVYSGTGPPAALAQDLVKPYQAYMQKKYGVHVNVKIVPGTSTNAWTELQTEWPNPTGDVYDDLYNENIKQGAAEGYFINLQKALGKTTWSTFDPSYVKQLDLGGYAAPMELLPYVLVVSDSIPKGTITSWSDLGEAKYKGRTVFDSALSVASGYNPLEAATLVQGTSYTDWFSGNGTFDAAKATPAFHLVEQWAKNAITLSQGSGTIQPLLQRGEALIAGWWWHSATQAEQAGLKTYVVFPKEGVPVQLQAGPVVSAKTKNPVAAEEWVRFFLSKQAYATAQQAGEVNRIPLVGQAPTPQFQQLESQAKLVPSTSFRADMLGSSNKQILNLYTQTVING